MGSVDLPEPRIGPASRLAPKPIKFVLNWGRRYSLWVFNFGLACCAIEFIATSMSRHDFIRLGVIPFAPGPRQADLMVVSGTVSDKMAPAVKRLYEQMPEPKYVISFGACSNCGGPYWDSYCVTKGVDQIIPVDVYVPGCPPRPEALLHGILKLQEKIAAESLGERYTGAGEAVAPPPPAMRRPPTPAVLRRPLVLPPVPEPEEIAAAEQPTQKLTPLRDGVGPAGTQELPPPAVPTGEAPAGSQDTAGTQEFPLPDAATSGEPISPAAETQEIPVVDSATTQDLPPVDQAGTPTEELPSVEEVRKAAEDKVAEQPTEVLPAVGDAETIQEPPPPVEEAGKPTEQPKEVLPSEEVRKAAEASPSVGETADEEKSSGRLAGGGAADKGARWLSGRLRRFAEPPPVHGDTDHTIIPGLSDDD
ncbi:NADH-quinone oxidoreductase subunit B [Actinoallomurus purpureus]|uniref:NADH-quinone oxidoreductase subunit B n=1 Tax=Actinoallomurus purpureus TaxID=478114 RepID=UPI0025AFAE70|nr:NADH-quinone oxidoreductase subunit NuoB [Actinoallomurus purpureus]